MLKQELIEAWLVKAIHDLDTAKIVYASLPSYDDTIAFHCQQVVEKTLKAFLIYLEIEFKPVHDLGYLLNLILTKDESLETYYDRVDELSRYAVQIRYPDDIIRLPEQKIREAIFLAEQIYSLISEKVFKQ